MFNKTTTGLFGGAANTSFGTSGTSFGTSTTPFGTTGFGSTGFGTQPTNGGLFGGSTAAPAATGGLFGGGTSTFGATPATNTGFSFGTATATVQPTVQTVPGAGGLFGTSNTGFGATAAQPASLFGNASQPMGGSTFGTQPNTAGSLFGGASFLGAGGSGTTGTVIKFVPVPGSDIIMKGGSQQSVATKLQCITGMKEYESKSLEELRLEDYAANRKGPQLQQQQTGLGFLGSTSQTTQASSAFGVFGQPTKPAFSGFGTTGNTGTSTSLFGQPQPQQSTAGSLFGASSQPKSLFGTVTTTTTASPFGGLSNNPSLFGQNNAAKPGGLFGTTPATQSTGLFGSTPAVASSAPGFGTTGFGGSNTFGSATTTGGLFGQKPTGFGATAQPTSFNFGQAQQPGTGVLGSTAGGLFGAKSTAANTGFSFGQPTNTGFTGFGATAPSGTLGCTTAPFGGGGLGLNLGGLGNTGTSLFQQNQAKQPTTGLGFAGFGGAGMGTGLNLGTTTTTLGGTGGGLGGASADLAAALLQQQQQVQQQLQVLNASPYGDSPLFRNLKQDPARKDELLRPTNPEAQKATLAASSQLKVTNRPNYRIKPKPLQSIITGKGQLFDGLEEDESSLDTETFVPRRNFKKLVIRSSNGSGGGLGLGSSSSIRGSSHSPLSTSLDNDHHSNARHSTGNSGGARYAENTRGRQLSSDQDANYAARSDVDLAPRDRLIGVIDNNQHQDTYSDHDDDSNPEYENSYIIGNLPENARADEPACHPTGVVLRRSDYYTLPSLNELVEMMDENGDCWVENFVVGRDGYGNVVFPGLTNVIGLDLDEIVHFRSKEIDVYPNDEKKPPFGEGLNKKAQVTLDRVWPVDKTSGLSIKDYDRLLKMDYLERLQKASNKIGAKFIDYRPETGSWVFEVKHFSKYGLLDDSDDDEDMVKVPAAGANKNLPQQPKQQLPIKLPSAATQQQVNDKQTGPFGTIAETRKDLGGETTVYMGDEEDAEMSDIVGQDQRRSQTTLGSETAIEEDEHEEDEEDEDVVPSSVCLARSLGVSAAQVQLQKASFFGIDQEDFPDEDYLHAESPFAQKKQFRGNAEVSLGLFPSGKHRRSVSPPPHPQRMTIDSSSAAGAGDVLSSPTKLYKAQVEGSGYQQSTFRQMTQQQQPQHPSFAHPLVPSALAVDKGMLMTKQRCSAVLGVIPYDESLYVGKQHLLMDVGLLHSRRSRVGWTRDWTLAHCGTPLATANDDDSDDDNGDGGESVTSRFIGSIRSEQKKKLKRVSPAQVVIESVSIAAKMSASSKVITGLLNECLQVELRHSDLKDDLDFPLYIPSKGVQLLQSYSEKMQTLSNSCDLADLMRVTWTLCTALWGDLQLTEEFTENTYVCQQARKVSLAHWLKISSEPTIEKEVQHYAKEEDWASVVFSYLTGGFVEKACEHALANENYHLALLIAQATGSEDCKRMIRQQLAMWADTSMDNFIDRDYLCLYALLAGTLVWKSSDQIINTCAELDWKRCLAVHLWFMCSSNTTVMESLKEYEKAFEGHSVHGVYAVPPRPSYMERLALDNRGVFDVCYHLLKLYSDRTHPLHVLLNPSTMSGNELDYSLSWHLLQVLVSLGYHHLSDVHQSMICTNYASQLESLGLWHWAVFVLLHIHSHNSRSDAVHQLLLRHVSIDLQRDNVEEDFIINNLHIKPESIHLAKAIRAKAEGRHLEEAWHLLKARKWNQCHDVIIATVAPEAIVNENYDMLQVLLQMLAADAEAISHIRDWNTGAGLYIDYFIMMDRFHQLRRQEQRDDSGSEMESLFDLASSLGTHISAMLCNNNMDSVCQAMISKHITDVMTLQMSGQPTEHELRLSADLLTSLPLPEGFALDTWAQLSHRALQAELS